MKIEMGAAAIALVMGLAFAFPTRAYAFGESAGAGSRQEAAVDILSKSRNPPHYPESAAQSGIEGTTSLLVGVDENGRITNIWIVKSSRNRDLDRAAMDAVYTWKFLPARGSDGAPIPGRAPVSVDFHLEK